MMPISIIPRAVFTALVVGSLVGLALTGNALVVFIGALFGVVFICGIWGYNDREHTEGFRRSIKMLRWLMSDEGKAMLRAELQQAIGDAKIPTTFERGSFVRKSIRDLFSIVGDDSAVAKLIADQVAERLIGK